MLCMFRLIEQRPWHLFISSDIHGLGNSLAKQIEYLANKSISEQDIFFISFSGGSLAKILCDHLPLIKTDWHKWKIFFCDERYVPIDDEDSNFALYQKLVNDTGIKIGTNIFPINYKLANICTSNYWESLEEWGNYRPQFDLLLLGIGPDGHYCPLFPHHKLSKEQEKTFVAIRDSPKPPPIRITMTLPLFNSSKQIFVIATGQNKAEIIKKISEDSINNNVSHMVPIQMIKLPYNEDVWFIDKEAASLLQ